MLSMAKRKQSFVTREADSGDRVGRIDLILVEILEVSFGEISSVAEI